MTAILGNSRRVRNQLHDKENVPLRKLGLIYNGIDTSSYRMSDDSRERRLALGVDPAALVFIIVANLIPYKGHGDLIEAFGLTARQLPAGWRLLVVGRDDGILPALTEQARALEIAENVMFLGPRRDIPDLLNCADVNLLSSHQEGFSNSILEGMAAGLPSIVTNVGGNAEAVIDGECGLVVPARDPRRLGEAIVKLAQGAALRARLGAAARLRVETHFTNEKCIEAYEELYIGLLAGKSPAEIPAIISGIK